MTRRRRALVFYSLILLLLIQCLPLPPGQAPSTASAASAADPWRILEITDSGTTDLSLGSSYKVDTFSMKKFVAMRTDIDGLYDAVYIGKGLYNPESLGLLTSNDDRDKAHKTKDILNDITRLKAQALIDGYVNKGLLVLLYSDSATKNGLLYQGKAGAPNPGVLYEKFSPYNTPSGKRENVLYLDANGLKNLGSTLAQTKYISLLDKRPQLKLTSSPVNYTLNPDKIYRAGDVLTFQYDKPARSGLRANLYLNQDSSLPYVTDQIVASSDAAGSAGQLSFRMPSGFSGLYYWKLELVDTDSGLKDYESGVIRYRDKLTQISVLQVMPNGNTYSALTQNSVLTQSFLSSEDYSISIRTTDMTSFNKAGSETSYDKISGRYDMLIFGFKDSYNGSAGISQPAADAVNAFIKTGQSVMFTHDTVYISSGTTDNVWTSNFKKSTGQTGTYTNIGLNARLASTTVQNVNDGLLTRFPFNLLTDSGGKARTPKVASTHDQYFMLDLEDPDVVPWYNITGGSGSNIRDPEDSYNHYYTYSKGNVTYSGTGHNFTTGASTFPEWEQQLFVNTMYRAYMGSNHKPDLNVQLPVAYSAAADNIIPAYQNIPVSFTPEDLDLNDRKLQAKVEFTYTKDGKKVTETKYQSSQALSGALISESYPNPLPKGGDIEVKFSVQDKQGAKSEVVIPVKIRVVSADLQVSRSIDGLLKESMAVRGKDFQLNYRILPQPVQNRQGEESRMVIASPTFTEKLPANIEVSGLPAGFSKTGTLAEGYTISGNLADIQYRPDASGTLYSASPVTFSLTAKALQTGSYSLSSASLGFRNIGQLTASEASFNAVSLEAVVPLTRLEITGAELGKGDSYKLLPSYDPADATLSRLTWTSSNPNAVIVNDNGTVTGLKENSSSVITVTDGITGISSSATVRVIQTGLSIATADGQLRYVLGSRIGLQASLLKSTGEIVSAAGVEWSVTPQREGDRGVEEKKGTDNKTWTGALYPTQPGEYAVSATVKTNLHTYTSQTVTIAVTEPDLRLSGPSVIVTGDNLAEWSRVWGSVQPVDAAARPIDYLWSWTPTAGAAGSSLSGSSTQSKRLAASQAGRGILRLETRQKLGNNEIITLNVRTMDISIAAAPSLQSGKNSLLPGETTPLTVSWPSSTSVPAYSAAWSTGQGGSISSGTSSGASFAALKPTTDPVRASAALRMETGFALTLYKDIAIIDPGLKLSGLYDRIAVNQSLTAAVGSSNPTVNLDFAKLVWSLESAPSSLAKTERSAPSSLELTALKPGTGTLKASLPMSEAYTTEASRSFAIVDFQTKDAYRMSKGDRLASLNSLIQEANPDSLKADILAGIVWTSSNSSIAKVAASPKDGYSLTGLNEGIATLTASYRANGAAGGLITRSLTVTVQAPQLSLDAPADRLAPGQSLTLQAGWMDPENGRSMDGLSWSLASGSDSTASLNPSAGHPGQASLTAKAPGTVQVQASVPLSDEDAAPASATKTFTVVDFRLLEELSPMIKGEKLSLKDNGLSVMPNAQASTIVPDISWTSSNANVVQVNDNGVLTAVGKGTATIQARYQANLETGGTIRRELAVTVLEPQLQIAGIGDLLLVGQSTTATASWAAGESLPLGKLQWLVSSGETRVRITPDSNHAAITGLSPGSVTLKAQIALNAGYVPFKTKTMAVVDYRLPQTLAMTQNDTKGLDKVLTVLPDKSYFERVSSQLVWTSSNVNVAAVENGLVKAKNRGSATLTATYGNTGIKRSVQVTVSAPAGDRY